MTPFVLPLTVRTFHGDHDLLIDLPAPITWGEIEPQLLGCAGLPTDTVLNLGVGPVEGSWVLGTAPLLAGTILSTVPQDLAPATGAVNLSCIAGPDAGRWVGLGDGPVIVGRGPDCDLSLDDPELSRWHARVQWDARGLVLNDLGSANGIRVDGAPRPRAGLSPAVPEGGLIRMGRSVLRSSLDAEPGLLLTADGAGHLSVARPARVAPAFRFDLPPPVGPAPERSRRPLPLLAAAIGGLAGAAIAIVTGLWTFLLLAALGPLMMLATALSDRLGGRRSHRREVADHRRALLRERDIRAASVVADRADAWDRYPDPATLARRAKSGSSRLWERRRDDPDFLRLSVGIGQRAARVLTDRAPMAAGVPITIGLEQVGVLGLAGECRPLLRHWIGQLAALHSPADLQLSIFSAHGDLARLRDLPHTAIDGHPGVLRSDRADAEVARLLCAPRDGPTTVMILDDAHRWRRTPRMNDLLGRAARPGTAGAGLVERQGWLREGAGPPAPDRSAHPRLIAICVAGSVEALPVECAAVAVVRSGVVTFAAGPVRGGAEVAGVSADYLREMVCSLAPLLDPDARGAGLPPEVTLAHLVGPTSFASLMDSRWASPTLSAVLGVGRNGPVTVDLERDGPHVLVAGTTGSGKSELLRTLIAGLVLAAPPDHTALVLIDYKGGAALGHLGELPHTAGVVSDLDAVVAARALAGLRAEVHRREQQFADHRVSDIAALRALAQDQAPPALVIIVDEFATLGAELPDFLSGLLDVAQRGRSLGLHLVLATQRPAGVLSPAIKANIGLRICLRVTDDADSIDVIDTPEAARLGAGQAGRALLRSERSRTTPFQVARVSGTATTGPTVRVRGEGRPVAPHIVSAGPTDLDRIVEAARAKATGLRTPRPPWTPPLPVLYEPSDPGVVGLVDRPSEQRQVGLAAPAGSILLLGPPGSGRSSGLRRLAWCAAHRGAALLVVDAGGSLSDLSGWPATRTYLSGEDPSLVQRLVRRLTDGLHQAAPSPGTPLLLVVDGWDAISGALETLDFGATLSAVADLAARGPASGLRVAVSGELRLQHHRVAGSFASVVRLGSDERGDARASVPGRGFHGSNEIQWAYAPHGIAPPNTPAPTTGPVIRPLPSRVDLTSVAVSPPTPSTVPIGVGGDDGSVRSVDLGGPGGGFLVAGPRRSGVTTALLVLATGAVAAGITVVRAHPGPLPPLAGAQDLDLRRGPEGLERLLTDHRGAILLVVDDFGGAEAAIPDGGGARSLSALLERFVTVAGPGQYLALGSRLDRAVRAHRGPVAEVAAMRCGLLLQADSADGGLLDAVLPRRRGRMVPGRGHLIRPGTVEPVQVAEP
jgi:S-DNA-T family DNA segregation ATPase FtsK/SpoIIIE